MRCFTLLCLLLIVSFTQTNFAQQPEIASARTGAITGRVLNDEGAPVAGATVSLGMVTNTPQTGRTATTDAEGNFVFRDLPARSYRLFAAQPGYVTDFDSVNAAFYHIGDNVTVNLVKGSVITGRVLNGVGEPVIAATVSAQRVRDPEGKPSQVSFSSARPAQTDDRGVYRIYGLMPGSYIVVVNSGAGFTTFRASPYDGDSPVYYPAATRDTASEVQVAAGATASGIDIRYRSEPGHIISGKLTGAVESARGSVSVNVTLRQAGSGNVVANGFGDAAGATQTYNLRGVADGDYEITATRFDNENGAAATPRRITVRGGDLTGVDLVLNPLATLAGRVVLEPADPANAEAGKCNPKRPPALEEVTLRLQRDEARPPENLFPGFSASDAAPDEKGDFKLVNLAPGRFRLVPALPTDAWYVKALTTAAAIPASAARRAATPVGSAAAAAPAITAAVGAVTLKAGDRQAGATVTLASGAAALQGQLIGKDNAKSAARLRVHLVPAETASAEDLLRYRESLSRADGAFEFKHLAPGKYWLLARPLADDESSERAPRPAAWDSAERAKLRREAEAAKQEVSLTTCQRAADFKLQFTAPVRVR